MNLNEKYEFEPVKNYIHIQEENIDKKDNEFLPDEQKEVNEEYKLCKVLTPNKKCYTDPSSVNLKVNDLILVKAHMIESWEGFVFVSESALVGKLKEKTNEN